MLPTSTGADDPRAYYDVRRKTSFEDRILHSVFPIVNADLQRSDPYVLLGTGFFIASSGIFITAKHVLEKNGEEHRTLATKPYVLQFLPGNKIIHRQILKAWNSDVSDLAVGFPEQSLLPNGSPLQSAIVPLSRHAPQKSERIFTYAFPNHRIAVDIDAKQLSVDFAPEFFAGSIVDWFPNGRDSSQLPWPCYHVDMHLHGGSSGGPVFDQSGRVFAVNCQSMHPHTEVAYVTSLLGFEDAWFSNIEVYGRQWERFPISEMIGRGDIVFR